MAETFADPQIAAREMIVSVEHPALGKLLLTGIPIKFSETPGSIRFPPPQLDEHRQEILEKLKAAL